MATRIETDLKTEGYGDIPVYIIGQRVMEGLKRISQVAYVRFASVYREFTDIESFQHEIARLIGEREQKEGYGNGEGSSE